MVVFYHVCYFKFDVCMLNKKKKELIDYHFKQNKWIHVILQKIEKFRKRNLSVTEKKLV